MSGDPAAVTAADAEAMLPPGPVVHVLSEVPGSGWVGCDRPRAEVLAVLHGAIAIFARPAGTAGHGLTVLHDGGGGVVTIHVETGQRRDDLHMAIGTYAAHLAGQASAAEVADTLRRVPPGQVAEYHEVTAFIRDQAGPL